MSIRTADIHRAIAFYERLGFEVCERFTAGITLACWMEGLGGRIELIQVPQPRSAPDAFSDEHYTGYYHLSFDLTDITENLSDWLDNLSQSFAEDVAIHVAETSANHGAENSADNAANNGSRQSLKILLKPTQQMIGDRVYEVAFIADADGLPLELIRLLGKRS
ncbi:MAG: VOC family protein [Elainellaceae cyanobacterium]